MVNLPPRVWTTAHDADRRQQPRQEYGGREIPEPVWRPLDDPVLADDALGAEVVSSGAASGTGVSLHPAISRPIPRLVRNGCTAAHSFMAPPSSAVPPGDRRGPRDLRVA